MNFAACAHCGYIGPEVAYCPKCWQTGHMFGLHLVDKLREMAADRRQRGYPEVVAERYEAAASALLEVQIAETEQEIEGVERSNPQADHDANYLWRLRDELEALKAKR